MTDEEIKALIAQCGHNPPARVVPGGVPSCLPPMWEGNLKDIADNWSMDRQVPVQQLNNLTALLNAQSVKGLTEGPQNQQALVSMLLQRQFINDNEAALRRAANENETGLFRGLTLSSLIKALDANELLKNVSIGALIEGLGWVRALQVDITGAKSISATVANQVSSIAQKAIDTAYGGVIGLGTLSRGGLSGIPQPLEVKLAKE
jgi:hypothetical protein